MHRAIIVCHHVVMLDKDSRLHVDGHMTGMPSLLETKITWDDISKKSIQNKAQEYTGMIFGKDIK